MTSLRKWCKGLNQRSKSYCLLLGSDRRAAHRKPAKVTRHNLLLTVQLECKHAILFLFLLFSRSVVSDSATPWTAACQAPLSFTISQSLLKLMSIESVMPSIHLILCRPLLLLPSIFPSMRVFSSESAVCVMGPKYWSFSFSISSSNEYSGLISFRLDWFDLLAVQGISRIFSRFYFAMHILAKVLHKLLIFVIKPVRPHRELMVWDFLGNCFAFWSSLTLFL